MNTMLAGEPIAVIQRSGADTRTWKATVAGATPVAVAVVLESPGFDEDGEVLLVAGERGSRRFTAASLARMQGGCHIFRVWGEWRPFDVRADRRFRVDLFAKVTSQVGRTTSEARVVDVSAGGMAVSLPAKFSAREVEVALSFDGYAARLGCRVVGSEPAEGGQLLHLQFEHLTTAQQAFVRNMVAVLEQQERLQSRVAS